MKCPRCKKHINYPTERQLLAWFYRYVYEYSSKDTAKIMGISPRNVISLIARLKKIWPNIAPKPRKKEPSFRQFDEEMHSQGHRF